MNYATQSFAQRYTALGDEAEHIFEQWAEENTIQYEPYGFSRPNLKPFWKIHPFVRKTPDYLCIGKYPFFCEVKGTGRANHVKMKEHDFMVLMEWNNYHPVWLFMYDNAQSQISFSPLMRVAGLCDPANMGTFPEGTTYYRIPKAELTWQPIVAKEQESYGY